MKSQNGSFKKVGAKILAIVAALQTNRSNNKIMARITIKNTKNVIFGAYKELLAKNEQLAKNLKLKDSEITKLRSSKGTVVMKPSKSAPAASITRSGSPEELGSIIAMLEGIDEGIGKAIAKFSAKQVVEAEGLEDVQAKIKEEKAQLQELYDIEMGDGAVDTIIDEYQTTEESFEKSFNEKQEAFEEDHNGKVDAWKEEKEDKATALKERKATVALEQKREKEEHNYNLKQERELENDSYKQKVKQLDQELADLKETKNGEMAVREKALKEKEEDFQDYESKHAKLPELLATAIKKAEEEAAGIIHRDAKIKANLLSKEMDTKKRSNEFRIASLQKTIGKQETQIAKLSAQLSDALKQAQTLALKALEGTANADSLDAIKAIAMEQAKHTGKK